jgi:hypothetical protein
VSWIRETPIAIEVTHFDIVRRARRAGFPARRLNRSQVSRFKPEVDLGWGCAAEPLMRLIGVVGQGSHNDEGAVFRGPEYCAWRRQAAEEALSSGQGATPADVWGCVSPGLGQGELGPSASTE